MREKRILQKTLARECVFEGKGLHTGVWGKVVARPAQEDAGLVFVREDNGQKIEASAANVSSTARSTTLAENGASISTVEHLLSAFTGMGIDNAEILVSGPEIPILDGSAEPFAKAFAEAGTLTQDRLRRYVEPSSELEVSDPSSGSWIRIRPAERPSLEVTIDFNSSVPGVQTFRWDFGDDYLADVAPCRTFVFLKEIEPLLKAGLIKGGGIGNAIVITPQGYMDNLELHFPDECARHKLLDLLGDLRLSGGFPLAKIQAYKPGHTINTRAAARLSALSLAKSMTL